MIFGHGIRIPPLAPERSEGGFAGVEPLPVGRGGTERPGVGLGVWGRGGVSGGRSANGVARRRGRV